MRSAYGSKGAGSKLTVLLNTQSKLPSSVKNLKAHPRTSRTLSAEPRSGPTVENRVKTFVFLPTSCRKSADVKSDMIRVTSNSPKAPAPLAWTTLAQLVRAISVREMRLICRSGILSLEK